jgi:hypothetical protein
VSEGGGEWDSEGEGDCGGVGVAGGVFVTDSVASGVTGKRHDIRPIAIVVNELSAERTIISTS